MSLNHKEIQPMPETILSVKLSHKFYSFSLPLPNLIPLQSLPLVKFNWKSVDKGSQKKGQSFVTKNMRRKVLTT